MAAPLANAAIRGPAGTTRQAGPGRPPGSRDRAIRRRDLRRLVPATTCREAVRPTWARRLLPRHLRQLQLPGDRSWRRCRCSKRPATRSKSSSVVPAAGGRCSPRAWSKTRASWPGKNVEALMPYARQGVPIVGTEPSCILTLRDEYRDLLPDKPDVERIAAEQLHDRRVPGEARGARRPRHHLARGRRARASSSMATATRRR